MADNPRLPLSSFPTSKPDNSNPFVGPPELIGPPSPPFQSTSVKETNSQNVDNIIDQKIGRLMGKKIEEIVKRIQKDLERQQSQLFLLLAFKIIGVTEAPDLGKYTPPWRGLSTKYVNYRFRKFGTPFSAFYSFRSDSGSSGRNLRTMLQAANPFTVFGKPLAGTVNVRTAAGSRIAVFVSPFPKITTSLVDDTFDEKDYFKSTNSGIAWRLRNWRGSVLRPVMRNFLLWWMNVILKDALRRSTRA